MQSARLKDLVAQAQQELDTALIDGQDTTEIRQRLKLAKEELVRVEALEASQVAEARTAQADVLEDYVAGVHQQDVRAIGEAISAILSGFTAQEITLPMHTLGALILARGAHEQALDAVTAHGEHIKGLEGRQATLLAERQHIVQRRAAGDRNDEADGRRLALIDADLTGLEGLIANARSQAPQNHGTTLANVQMLERQWDREKADALATALNALVYQLEDRLITTATLLRNLTPAGSIGKRYRMDLRLAQVTQSRLF
jgi:hypothetical protein